MDSPTGKRCITYGTFDLFHEGHLKLLQRIRELGSHLTIGVTSDSFDTTRGKLNVRQSLMQRIEGVQNSGVADQIIIEEYQGQKVHDIIKYEIDIFAVGSDWTGFFDYLATHCEVIYLERTAGVSSTQLRGKLRLGIIGCGRIAKRFVKEVKFVSGVRVEAVLSRSLSSATTFAANSSISNSFGSLEELLDVVDAVYIASPHLTHVTYATSALMAGKHVLCEKPLCFTYQEAEDLYKLACQNEVVLLEAIKTAFLPGFRQMIAVAQSKEIGTICSISSTCTTLKNSDGREFDTEQAGGSITELASYPLLANVKFLNHEKFTSVSSKSIRHSESGIDILSRIDILTDSAMATGTIALGVKAEGDLVIAGTEGYLYVPAPWWTTKSFQVRFEDTTKTRNFNAVMEGDGLRYELAEFIKMISERRSESANLTIKESCAIAKCMEGVRANCQTIGVQYIADFQTS